MAKPSETTMKVLHFVHAHLAHSFYTWALREIDPLHKDVSFIVHRIRELDDKIARLES